MGKVRALKNVKSVELVGLPRLTKCVLLTAFRGVEELKMENAGKLEENEVLREVERRREVEKEKEKEEEKKRKKKEEEERQKREKEKKKKEEEEKRKKEEEEKRIEESQIAKKTMTITNKMGWDSVDCMQVGVIVVSNRCCNESGLVKLNMKGFVHLRELRVGNNCFKNVEEVKLIGLKQLERVVIGDNSFAIKWFSTGKDPNRHFYLKNCERLKELRIGCDSFVQYSVCKIENVDSLEVIAMGMECFSYASLELKSESKEKRMTNRHAQFEVTSVSL